MNKLAIFGGTFNPIHAGHLMIAEQMRQLFDFNRIFFVPSAMPPHKSSRELVGSSHRLIMTALATLDNPHFTVSSFETKRGGKSYTIDTLKHFRRIYGNSVRLYFLLGADAFLEISTWRNVPLLFELTRFVVIERPGANLREKMEYFCHNLMGYNIEHQVIDQTDPPNREPVISDTARVYSVRPLLVDISSSRIRSMIRKGKSVKYLLPDPVKDYIAKNRLYREDCH